MSHPCDGLFKGILDISFGWYWYGKRECMKGSFLVRHEKKMHAYVAHFLNKIFSSLLIFRYFFIFFGICS